MTRWYWKRAALVVVTGLSLSTGSLLSAAEKDTGTGYQPNDVIVVKTTGKPDQKVTVVRSRRQADGRVFTEVKDAEGKTFTMIDEAPNGAIDKASQVVPAGAKDGLPRAKPRENDVPPASALAVGDSPRKRLFGRDKSESTPTPAPAVEPEKEKEKEKKPSLFSRLFSSKKKDEPTTPPTPPAAEQPYQPPVGQAYQPPVGQAYPPPVAMQPRVTAPAQPNPLQYSTPSTSGIPGVPSQMPVAPGRNDLAPWNQVLSPTPAAPAVIAPNVVAPNVVAPIAPTAPSVVAPTVIAPTTKPSVPGVTTGTTRINLTPEPPTARPSVPAPAVTAPVVAPSVIAPTVITPPLPTAPALPVVPVAPPVSVPALPTPLPGSSSMTKPANSTGIRTVGHTEVTVDELPVFEDIKREVAILKESKSAAERLMTVRCLAGGHYAWRAETKAVLFYTARHDSTPAVRAQCIVELRKLGFYEPAFITFLGECDKDANVEVRDAAKAALEKMTTKN